MNGLHHQLKKKTNQLEHQHGHLAQVSDFRVQPGCEEGENLLSDLLAIDVELVDGRRLHLMAKLLSQVRFCLTTSVTGFVRPVSDRVATSWATQKGPFLSTLYRRERFRRPRDPLLHGAGSGPQRPA